MTTEEIKAYTELNEKFIKDCERVKKIFTDLEDVGGYIQFADTFYCEDDEVAWQGSRERERGIQKDVGKRTQGKRESRD